MAPVVEQAPAAVETLEKVHAAASEMVLEPTDIVGVTFMLATGMMLASSVFFFMERSAVPFKWRPSMTIAGLVTGVAFWNYTFMREAWLTEKASPLVYRYCDWIITVPLQIVEFYFILAAGNSSVGAGVFWQLVTSSLLMLVFGYVGEAGIMPAFPAWVLGMIAWLYIVYYTFAGAAGSLAAKSSGAQQQAFSTIRLIVSVGWIIYPVGYLVGMMKTPGALAWLNGIYNIADLVNKTGFGLAIYAAAMSDTSAPGYQQLAA